MSRQGIDKLYTLSYQWLTPVGILVTILIGTVVSIATGKSLRTIQHILSGALSKRAWCLKCTSLAGAEFRVVFLKENNVMLLLLTGS